MITALYGTTEQMEILIPPEKIASRFVIGYGLDYKERYRHLPDVLAFINDTPQENEIRSNKEIN